MIEPTEVTTANPLATFSSSMIYTYAIIERPTQPLALPTGFQSDRLVLIESDRLTAVVEPGFTLESIESDEEQLLQAVVHHDFVIRALFERTTVLPLRFGTCFRSEDLLKEHLRSQAAAYQKTLDRVSDRAEYTLKLTPAIAAEPKTPTEAKGKNYLLAKKQRFQRQQAEQRSSAGELETLVAAIAATYPDCLHAEAREKVERLHFLVDRAESDRLPEQLQEWRALAPRWELQLGEPLPPYHFVA